MTENTLHFPKSMIELKWNISAAFYGHNKRKDAANARHDQPLLMAC